ncbi:MAG: hypothetical protein PHD01_02830 [Geobacteraceae bacterium]|nr:hypothetical protein [Geobacteraceae bacterium]
MRSFVYFTAVLMGSLFLVPEIFASDWDSILPPGSQQTEKPEIVPTQKVLTVGETLVIPLPGNKSYSCPVEVAGDSVKIVAHDVLQSVTLQGVTSGTSTVRIYREFWRDPDGYNSSQLIQVLEIAVRSGFRESPLPGQRDEIAQTIPIPVSKGSMEWEGYLSRQGEEFVTAITNGKEWNALWQRAFGTPAPELDFEKYGVACVFLGFHADWLYGIQLGEPCLEGDLQVIPYDLIEIILELQGPFRASGQYHMKAYEKKKGYGMIVQQGSCKEKGRKRGLLPGS